MKKRYIAAIAMLCLCLVGCGEKKPIENPPSPEGVERSGSAEASSTPERMFESYQLGDVLFMYPTEWILDDEMEDTVFFNFGEDKKALVFFTIDESSLETAAGIATFYSEYVTSQQFDHDYTDYEYETVALEGRIALQESYVDEKGYHVFAEHTYLDGWRVAMFYMGAEPPSTILTAQIKAIVETAGLI